MSQLFRLPGSVRRDPAIEVWLHQQPDELAVIARRWFEELRSCGDDVRERIHDDQPTACVDDAAFAYVDAFTSHVNVGFFRGAELPDPGRLLEGTGKFMRHVKLRPDREVDPAALLKIIDAAYTDMKRRVDTERVALNRRDFLACFSAMGLGSTLMPEALTIAAQGVDTITLDVLEAAQKIARVSFTREEQQAILTRLNAGRGYLAGFAALRAAKLGDDEQPAIVFNPVPPGKVLPSGPRGIVRRAREVSRPASDEALAFLPLTDLARLVQTRQVKPSELTELYLSRLAKYDPALRCVVSLTPELARSQARDADAEIAAGKYRGPLHGIPYGLKDLFAVRGTKTTWGASPWEDRVIDNDATVYSKLREAGAILVAKLSTGALAVGAQWFGGLTRNPWNLKEDASGSSAGSGAATAAGLVGFAIGSDTGGSIVQPAERNGIAGLRPTFGRVSRFGGMTLAWTQDTVGPLCRSVEDCALVFDAIYGPDGKDNSVLDVPFRWDATSDVRKLRVGYLRSGFTTQSGETSRQLAVRRNSEAALQVIRGLGVQVVPFDLPPVEIAALDFIRWAETAAFFDEPTRSGTLRDIENGPEQSTRPADIRSGRFIPAVDYIQANRYRSRVMQQMDDAMSNIDLFLGSNALLTNRLGLPILSMPSGFAEGSPTALHMTGKLFGEPELFSLAQAFQSATDHHVKRPTMR
jgi:Asp-tRNA(Asn)/Glu-tRNA(Gln) amidotransferase A subunit family amidase